VAHETFLFKPSDDKIATIAINRPEAGLKYCLLGNRYGAKAVSREDIPREPKVRGPQRRNFRTAS